MAQLVDFLLHVGIREAPIGDREFAVEVQFLDDVPGSPGGAPASF
jgi:hypothetical protein